MPDEATPRTVHVLLVEDDAADELLMQEALRQAPVPVDLDVVEDGIQALDYLRGEGEHRAATIPDLIVLDLKLPRMSGLECLAVIKADPQLRHVPVIILSTSDAQEDIRRSYDLQASCYLIKPSDLAEYERVMNAFKEFLLGAVALLAQEKASSPP